MDCYLRSWHSRYSDTRGEIYHVYLLMNICRLKYTTFTYWQIYDYVLLVREEVRSNHNLSLLNRCRAE